MAAVFRTWTAGSGSSGTAERKVTFTANVNDLLFVFCNAAQGTPNLSPTCDDSVMGADAYTLLDARTWMVGSVSYVLSAFVSKQLATAGSHQITVRTGNNDAAIIVVVAVSGMSVAGATAVRQVLFAPTTAAGNTPAVSLPAAALTDNLTIGVIGSASTGFTPPSGWTEIYDNAPINPVTAIEAVYRNTGFTGTDIAWQSTSSTDYVAAIVELAYTHWAATAEQTESAEAVDAPAGAWHALAAAQETTVESTADSTDAEIGIASQLRIKWAQVLFPDGVPGTRLRINWAQVLLPDVGINELSADIDEAANATDSLDANIVGQSTLRIAFAQLLVPDRGTAQAGIDEVTSATDAVSGIRVFNASADESWLIISTNDLENYLLGTANEIGAASDTSSARLSATGHIDESVESADAMAGEVYTVLAHQDEAAEAADAPEVATVEWAGFADEIATAVDEVDSTGGNVGLQGDVAELAAASDEVRASQVHAAAETAQGSAVDQPAAVVNWRARTDELAPAADAPRVPEAFVLYVNEWGAAQDSTDATGGWTRIPPETSIWTKEYPGSSVWTRLAA